MVTRLPPPDQDRLRTGIPELDVVLRGGLPRRRIHLIEGKPGTGKTTIALRYLIEGREQNDCGLYIAMSETADELRATARSHGWNLEGIHLCEVVPSEARLDEQQSVLLPSEAELSRTVKQITDCIERVKPARVVIDSMAELRLLAEDPSLYRRQMIALKQYLLGKESTVMLLDDLTAEPREYELQSMVHGVISLEQRERSFGSSRRSMRVVKLRGADFQSGWHDFAIIRGEVLVFPSLIAQEHRREHQRQVTRSDIDSLDEMLGGGLVSGTSTMILGPSGVGKSSLALQYAAAAARRQEKVAYFAFDEGEDTLRERATGLGMTVADWVEQGAIQWERINPSRISPGEFIWKVRRQVEDGKVSVVVIDSLNSYLEVMHEEQALLLQMHELLTYLSNMGVMSILVVGQVGMLEDVHDPLDVAFITDNVILLRYFEADGLVRKAISVVKKRPGRHETAIREFALTEKGLRVGPRLDDFEGVLTGTPRFAASDAGKLINTGNERQA